MQYFICGRENCNFSETIVKCDSRFQITRLRRVIGNQISSPIFLSNTKYLYLPFGDCSSIVIQKYSRRVHPDTSLKPHISYGSLSSLSNCEERNYRPLILAAAPTHTSMAEPEAAPEVKGEVTRILFKCKRVHSQLNESSH